jgi:hypothetical protein
VEQVPAAIWTAADGQPISKAILSKNGLREFPYPLFSFASTLHGARFRQKFTLEDAIGSHTCSLEAPAMRVTDGIPLGRPLAYRFTL